MDAVSQSNHGCAGHRGADDIVARAEEVCRARKLQFTPWRRRVLEELANGRAPLGAYDLIERLATERRISPISVYRALDFLMEAGLVHRIAARNTYLPCCHQHGTDDATVFLVCTRCGGVAELTSAAVARGLNGMAQQAGFRPHERSVELAGECSTCREAA